ncbi:hypothetical protein DW66_3793 [Pseudomonas putida]|nr:hypothetical protein DW66_3636 [Pseudomonas putida]AHZ78298.1 hypothetical protein DW66_3793 [Pseudomonas putida]
MGGHGLAPEYTEIATALQHRGCPVHRRGPAPCMLPVFAATLPSRRRHVLHP